MSSRAILTFSLAASAGVAGLWLNAPSKLTKTPMVPGEQQSQVSVNQPTQASQTDLHSNSFQSVPPSLSEIQPAPQSDVSSSPQEPANRGTVSVGSISPVASSATATASRYEFSKPPIPEPIENELEIIVPSGLALPIALLRASADSESSPELNQSQQTAADRIAEDFVREVASNNPDQTPDASLRWSQLAAAADERFRSLMGQDAYNREVIRQSLLNKQTLPNN